MSFQNPQFRSVTEIFYEVPALAERIRDSYGAIQIIGIDGFTTAGKTTLAKCLSRLLDADLVSTDDHLEIKGGDRGYVERLDLEGIKNAVDRSIRAGRRCILEGICLRQVIACSAIPADSSAHVYVKRISSNSDTWDWDEEGWLECFEQRDHPEPHLSAYRYHVKFCPHKLAKFEYRWRE